MMVDFRGPAASMPHRKPVPLHHHQPHRQQGASKLSPLTQIVPDSQQPFAAGRQSMSSAAGRPRISPSYYSSQSPYPAPLQPSPLQLNSSTTKSQQSGMTMASTYQNPYAPTRRTLSNATASTSTTGSSTGGLIPARTNSSASASLHRSTSSRSGGGSPTSYVALMRKQKATVWCDRTQHEDPRLLAQQKAAKVRATLEVVGGRNVPGLRTSTTSSMLGAGVRSRIRHHGAQKTVGYSTANLAGDGVPLRLSASEVGDDGDSEGESARPSPGGQHQHHHHHQRSSSGRSSLASERRHSSMGLRPQGVSPGRFSQGSGGSPPGTSRLSGGGPTTTTTTTSTTSTTFASAGPVAELAETPASNSTREDYFNRPRHSDGSGSGGTSSGSLSDYTPNAPTKKNDNEQPATSEELRRRGSVDDRTMTMSGVRLFVANPDLSD